jgi:hypothetical protein
MPRSSNRNRHPADRPLTLDEELELLVGPGRIPGEPGLVSDFDSDEERREAWLAHEDEIREACGIGEPWAAEHYR